MDHRPVNAFFLKSSLNYAICGESFALSFMSQYDPVCGLILISMVASLVISPLLDHSL